VTPPISKGRTHVEGGLPFARLPLLSGAGRAAPASGSMRSVTTGTSGLTLQNAIAHLLGLAAGAKRLRRRAVGVEDSQQRIDLHTKSRGQPVQHIDCRVHGATLDAAQIRRRHRGIHCERLLCQPSGRAQVPEIPCEASPSFHEPEARGLCQLIHDVYARNCMAGAFLTRRQRSSLITLEQATQGEERCRVI